MTALAPVPAPLARLTREEAEATARHMAAEYADATAAMRRHLDGLDAEARRIQAAFADAVTEHDTYNRFELDVTYDRHRVYRHSDGRDPYADLFAAMNRKAWAMLIDNLGVKNVMSVKKRAEFEKQLESGDLPEVTERAILDVIFGLIDQARDFATEAAREVFEILRPGTSSFQRKYATNSPFRVGRRVILTWMVDRGYGKSLYRVSYSKDAQVRAIDGVFHLLDGKGVVKDHVGPLRAAIEASADGTGETEYFRFRCFKNGNLHLEFKRPDLVKQLNGLAAGEHVLGEDPE